MKKFYYSLCVVGLLLSPLGNAMLSAQGTDINPPKSYFDFEGSDDVLTDSGSEENHGAITAGAENGPERAETGITTAAEDGKGCIEMKGGTESHLTIPYNAYLDAPSYTLSMWIKYTVNTAWDGYLLWNEGDVFPPDVDERHIDVWTNGNGTPDDNENYGWTSQNDIVGGEERVQSIGTTTSFGSDFLTDETWHLFTLTLEDNLNMKMYCDDVLLVETNFAAEVVTSTKNADLWIGGRPPETKPTLQAFIDRVRIWDEALTAEQIAALTEYEGPEGGDASKVNWVTETAVSNIASDVASLNNYPNPFSGETTVAFTLNEASNIELSIINIAGKKVASVLNDYRAAGNHEISINAADLNSGVYFLQMETNKGVSTTKLVVTE